MFQRPINGQQSVRCELVSHEAACCLLDTKIYIVGGYNWHLNNVTSIVQVYNTETDEWERDLHFTESFAGIACTPIVLPQTTTQR